MIDFPVWSDLGMENTSSTQRTTWEGELGRAQKYWYYFTGHIFKEKVDEIEPGQDPPLLYPVGLNLTRMMCLAHADATYGEWEGLPVTFETAPEKVTREKDKAATELMSNVLRRSRASSMLWRMELERLIFGGSAMKISPTLSRGGGVIWRHIPKGSFYPVWDPANPDKLLQVEIVNVLNKEQAKLKYGYTSKKANDNVVRVEKWTSSGVTVTMDDTVVREEAHTWGEVPFVYIPRYRIADWWGESLTETIMPIQDEINMRIGDIGEAINYNAHPVRWGINLANRFDQDNFPLGPNSMWDLGRALGNSPEPEVGALELENPIPKGSFEYVQFLYDWARTASFAPPIAFGEDNGGGQRSGITLQIRLWPLIKATKRSRAFLRNGLLDAMRITAKIYKQKEFPSVGVRSLDSLLDERIDVGFARLLPKDQSAAVDEVNKLFNTQKGTLPPAISLETAQKVLGRGQGEVDRIVKMISDPLLSDYFIGAMEDEAPEDETSEKPEEANDDEDSISNG